MTAGSLTIDQLALRCAEETDKFGRRQPNDAQYCFELLRRALAETSDEAFTSVCRVYERQVTSWVYSHTRFAQTGETADYFVQAALRTFYFALRGPKFDRFPSLPQVLSYLKLCVHTAIAQYVRDQQPRPDAPLDEVAEVAETPDLGMRADLAELWQYICSLLPEEGDQLLARCAFMLDLKPSQVVKLYPGRWESERDVSVALYRIRRALRNDAGLRVRFGIETENE